MKVRKHASEDARAPERGREFGAAWSDEISTAVDAYLRHFDAIGIPPEDVRTTGMDCHEALLAWCPELAGELEQIAAGARIPLAHVAILNARTEILGTKPPPAEGECSTAVRLETPVVGFQTWDWNADLTPTGVVWHYRTDAGRRVSTFTEPGILAKIGVNDSGLSLLFNILHHLDDGGGAGVPVHAIARRILDAAGDLTEAVEIARSATAAASSALTVVATTPEADALTLEVTPAGVGVVRHLADGWLLHTNHLLDPKLAVADNTPPTSTTTARLAHLESVVGPTVDVGSLASLARGLCIGGDGGGGEGGDGDGGGPAGGGGASLREAPICVAADPAHSTTERRETLLTVRIDATAAQLDYWPGRPSEVPGV